MDAVELWKLGVAGEAIERKHHKDIAELFLRLQTNATYRRFYVPVASLPYTPTSDAGHLMASNWRRKCFAACYWDT